MEKSDTKIRNPRTHENHSNSRDTIFLSYYISPGIGVIDPRMISVMSDRAFVDLNKTIEISRNSIYQLEISKIFRICD